MQKEQTNQQSISQVEESISRATPEPQPNESGGTGEPLTDALQTGKPANQTVATTQVDSQAEFEELIKGPYKEAFAAKVQGIINKRFKQEKQKQESQTEADLAGAPAVPATQSTEGAVSSETAPTGEDSLFKTLLEAGIDAETAYRALHFDEIMDASARYAASMAAKQLADSIRLKGARPAENGTQAKNGFAPHRGAAGLTPEKRREMAEKALMGKQVGF